MVITPLVVTVLSALFWVVVATEPTSSLPPALWRVMVASLSPLAKQENLASAPTAALVG